MGLIDNQLKGIAIYGFESNLFIQIPDLNQPIHVNVFNQNGTKVLQGILSEINNKINMENISSGIYLVEVFSNLGRYSKPIFID